MFCLFSDLVVSLPYTLTHPKPKQRVISRMVTFPPRSSLNSMSDSSKTDTPSGTAPGLQQIQDTHGG